MKYILKNTGKKIRNSTELKSIMVVFYWLKIEVSKIQKYVNVQIAKFKQDVNVS